MINFEEQNALTMDKYIEKENFLVVIDHYGIQPILSSRDERHIIVMIRNWKSHFKMMDENIIRNSILKDIKPEDMYYAFVDLQTGNCVGFGSAKHVSDDCLEVGYEIISDKQRQGIGSICISMYIDYLREFFDKELIANVYSDNVGSIKILEKAGAVKVDSEESDYAKFIRSAAGRLDSDLYTDAIESADTHCVVKYRL